MPSCARDSQFSLLPVRLREFRLTVAASGQRLITGCPAVFTLTALSAGPEVGRLPGRRWMASQDALPRKAAQPASRVAPRSVAWDAPDLRRWLQLALAALWVLDAV